MHALIDVDILCYEMGNARDPDSKLPLNWPLVRSRVDERIDYILEVTQADTWQGYLTGKGNFRDAKATILPYKGPRRKKERPFWYQGIYNYLRDDRNCIVVYGMEADDALAIAHTENYEDNNVELYFGDPAGTSIDCSRDKDLKQLPGWHYSWPGYKQKEAEPVFIGETDALRFFYSQLLTGDSADNILGLYNIGAKSACVKAVNNASNELEMFSIVRQEYEKRFGSYWKQFLEENGTLLWLLRSEGDSWRDRQLKLNGEE